jgi:catechol 2,3-dioxygenase-like lactoylglutathione lyase family enzyme
MCLAVAIRPEPNGATPVGAHEGAPTWAAAPGDGPPIAASSTIEAARAFYCDALRGRQVWRTGSADAGARLWFLVGETLVEVGSASRDAITPITLSVESPSELAERCWDAGFTVRVHDDGTGRAPLSVLDPLGRRIELAPRETTPRPRVTVREAQR